MKIYIKDIEKYYGDKKVINKLNSSFTLQEGNIYGIVGHNGAGKTTLFKILSGILLYNSGEISLDNGSGKDYLKWCKSNVAFILAGERGLRLKNTVYDNVIYYGVLKGSKLSSIKNNIKKYSKLFKIEDLLDRRIEELSTGEKKKAGILCGLCSNMQVIILDEPSLGLDIDSNESLKKMLVKISNDIKTTIIISSHDVNFLSSIANKYRFIVKGKNIFSLENSMKESEIIETYLRCKNKAKENERIL